MQRRQVGDASGEAGVRGEGLAGDVVERRDLHRGRDPAAAAEVGLDVVDQALDEQAGGSRWRPKTLSPAASGVEVIA